MANQNDTIMQFVQGLAQTLQADPNEVILIAQLNPEALKSAVQIYQLTQDMQQAAQAFQQALQLKVKAAKHGAKLSYIKSLKNQCSDDEELYYFKKGGSIGCGCVKKKETGGKAPQKISSVDKFKNRKLDLATKDSIEVNVYGNDDIPNKNPGDFKRNKQGKVQWTPDRTKAPYKKEKGGKVGDKKVKLVKKGNKVCPKCGKIHSAGMGCSVANFKLKYQWGGNLLKKGLDGFKNTMTKTIVKGKDPYKFKYTRTINDYIDKKSGKVLKSDTTYSKLNISFSNQPITTSPSSNEDDLLFKKVYFKFKKGFGDK